MKRVLKWAGIGLAALLANLVVAAAVLYFVGGSRLNTTYDLQIPDVTIPTDSAAIARGHYLAEAVMLCHGCHGADLEGHVIFDDPSIASIYASNLTTGRGGIGSEYSDVDFARAIRHGINRSGRGLMIMHSDAFHNLGENDLGAVIAHLRSTPPVDNEVPKMTTAPLGRILVALGLFDSESMPLIPAEVIDHSTPFAEPPPLGPTPEYGEYLVSIGICRMCHGADLNGGPPIEEGAPPGPSILPYGGHWTEEDFVRTIRTGVTPYDKTLDEEVMPWRSYTKMTDEDLAAIRAYVASLSSRTR
jgi:mono/diheme cytochrome c family protein